MHSVRVSLGAAARAAALAALLSLAIAPRTDAQDTSATRNLRPTPDSQVVAITLRDGSSLIGRVLEVTPTIVRFRSAVGELSIPRESIVSVRATAADRAHGGEYWPEDPSRTPTTGTWSTSWSSPTHSSWSCACTMHCSTRSYR